MFFNVNLCFQWVSTKKKNTQKKTKKCLFFFRPKQCELIEDIEYKHQKAALQFQHLMKKKDEKRNIKRFPFILFKKNQVW